MLIRAFLIIELFEQIILYLPIETVLSLKRVCQYFKNTIDESNRIQEHLFFYPSIASKAQPRVELNPILAKCFPPWFGKPPSSVTLESYMAKIDAQGGYPMRGDKAPETTWKQNAFTSIPWASSAKATEAFRRRDASWRRMFLSQPPVLKLRVQDHQWHCRYGYLDYSNSSRTIVGKSIEAERPGLRMGLYYDLVQQEMIWTDHGAMIPGMPLTATYMDVEFLVTTNASWKDLVWDSNDVDFSRADPELGDVRKWQQSMEGVDESLLVHLFHYTGCAYEGKVEEDQWGLEFQSEAFDERVQVVWGPTRTPAGLLDP